MILIYQCRQHPRKCLRPGCIDPTLSTELLNWIWHHCFCCCYFWYFIVCCIIHNFKLPFNGTKRPLVLIEQLTNLSLTSCSPVLLFLLSVLLFYLVLLNCRVVLLNPVTGTTSSVPRPRGTLVFSFQIAYWWHLLAEHTASWQQQKYQRDWKPHRNQYSKKKCA